MIIPTQIPEIVSHTFVAYYEAAMILDVQGEDMDLALVLHYQEVMEEAERTLNEYGYDVHEVDGEIELVEL